MVGGAEEGGEKKGPTRGSRGEAASLSQNPCVVRATVAPSLPVLRQSTNAQKSVGAYINGFICFYIPFRYTRLTD